MRWTQKAWLWSAAALLAMSLGTLASQAPPPEPPQESNSAPPIPVPPSPPPAAEDPPKPVDKETDKDKDKDKAPGLIVVYVPDNAVIWFGEQKMTQTGTKRTFQSPPLEPGKNYFYTMKIARPNPTAGQPDTVSEHEVGVAPGRTTEINFLKPGEGVTVPPGQLYTPPRRILPPLFRPSEGSGYR